MNTPIFDEVLADSDPDIFLASNIFPNPTVPDWAKIWAAVQTYAPYPPIGWSDRFEPAWRDEARYKAKVLGEFAEDKLNIKFATGGYVGLATPIDPANLSFLGSVT